MFNQASTPHTFNPSVLQHTAVGCLSGLIDVGSQAQRERKRCLESDSGSAPNHETAQAPVKTQGRAVAAA